MAGDWIKFEKATLDKPEVYEIAGMLQIDPDAVVGKLLRVWDWFDDQSRDGYAPVTLMLQLDRNTGVTGFVKAMASVGWAIIENDRIGIPNFSRHNGQTAKDRALSAKRMAKQRGKSYANVTPKSVTSTVTSPQPEKRREEKSNTPISPDGDLNLMVEEITKPDPVRIKIGKMLGRRESTKWSDDEIAAYSKILPLHPDDIELMSAFYAADIPAEKDHRRTSLGRLLNHWNGELDKARAWKAQNR